MENKKAVGIIDFIGVKGGHHYYSLCLLNALESSGVDTFYFSNFQDPVFSKTKCIKLFEKDIQKDLSGLWQLLRGTWRAIGISKKYKIETHIFHAFEASILNCIILGLLKLTGFKTIVIVHDVKSFDFPEKKWVRRVQYNRLSDELIVHNRYSFDVFNTVLPERTTPLHIIAHGGHLDLITPLSKKEARKKLGLDQAHTYFLFFGQIKKVKGLDLLLEAFPKQPGVKLIIAGKPWRDDFSEYQAIIERRQLYKQVNSMIRYIDDGEKDLLYSATDFVVLPYKEIYQSGVLLMSMSYGRPVIASDLPAIRSIVKKGGLLFNKGDVNDLTACLKKASELNPDELGENASNTIREDFDWYQISQYYLPLLRH